jgi:hypothetical protein
VDGEDCGIPGRLYRDIQFFANAILAIGSDKLPKVDDLLAADPTDEVPKVNHGPVHLSDSGGVERALFVEKVVDNAIGALLLELGGAHNAKAVVGNGDEASAA